MGRSSSRARASASGPHGYQSTGLWACCNRYGLVSSARRFTGHRGRSDEVTTGSGRSMQSGPMLLLLACVGTKTTIGFDSGAVVGEAPTEDAGETTRPEDTDEPRDTAE